MAHTAEEWFQIGLSMYEESKFHKAIESLSVAIQSNPNFAKARHLRGRIKYETSDYSGAEEDLTESVQIDPTKPQPFFDLGITYLRLGDLNNAINCFNKFIKIDPFNSYCYFQRGTAYYHLGQYLEALLDFDTSIQIDSSNYLAYSNRGNAREKLGDFDGAIKDYSKAIILMPSPETYNNRGSLLRALGDFQGALADFNSAIKINSWYGAAYFNRGSMYASFGDDYSALLDFNCFLKVSNNKDFWSGNSAVFLFFSSHPAPYLLHRTFSKFTYNFDQFNTIHPITDTTRQQCRPWKRWEEWRNLSGSEQHESLAHYHALALVNHYMGDCIEAYRIYDEVLDDEKTMGVPLNLMGLYYYIESAKLFRQPHEVILEDAIEQIEETRDDLIENNAFRELYYAGQILWANDQIIEAHEFFELADEYLPAAYMQLLTLPMMGAEEEDLEAKIADLREREAALTPNEGFLQGFPSRPFRLEKPGEDFFAPMLHYAHYREIAQAIAEVRDSDQPFEHHEMWDAFYWEPEDEKELDWLLRRERLAEINKELLEKFRANVQSGSGVHSLEHLELAFAQKLKHDLWEGTSYLNFEDFKSKSEAWPNAAQEVAALIRGSRRLDANSKLLLVEYCHLRGNLSIEDTYLLYFYISYVNTSQDTGIASEANSAAVKKVVELTLAPVSVTGKVLTAAAGGAIARLFKLFLSESGKKDQINMDEFQKSETSSTIPDDFEVFCENFLRFISYQRETLGKEAFEKQYPLEGFEDKKEQ